MHIILYFVHIYIYIYIFFFFFFPHFILCILCVVFYHGTTLAGYHQTPNASTTEATWARDSVCRKPWHPMTTTPHPWADGWELSVKCAGVVSIPGHLGMLRTPHTAHHQAPLSARGHRVVVVPGCHGSLRTESQPAGSHSTQKNYTLHPSFSINQNGTAHAKSTYPTYALSQNLLYCQFCHMYSTYIERTFRIEITLLSSQVRSPLFI